jgi:hypothetical protein
MARYELTVASAVGPVVLEALEGFQVAELASGHSRLVGEVPDQAAFHGLLNRLQDLRLEIIEIKRVDGP